MRARYVAILLSVLLGLSILWLRWEVSGTSELVEIDYSGRVHISAPCAVVKIGSYIDGGSIGGILRDAQGHEIAFWWDGAMRLDTPEALAAPRLAYIGTDLPRDENMFPIPVGSQGELDFIQALAGWVNSVIPPDDQERIYSTYFDYTRRWEDRMELLPGFDKEMERAILTLRVIRALEEQRAEFGGTGDRAGVGL